MGLWDIEHNNMLTDKMTIHFFDQSKRGTSIGYPKAVSAKQVTEQVQLLIKNKRIEFTFCPLFIYSDKKFSLFEQN